MMMNHRLLGSYIAPEIFCWPDELEEAAQDFSSFMLLSLHKVLRNIQLYILFEYLFLQWYQLTNYLEA